MPLHSKAREFSKRGLFSRLTSFSQLERRISELGENKLKGDAFEVFAEAYLTVVRKHDAEQIWPFNAISPALMETVGFLGKDHGVDGLFRTSLGELGAYQVKFRTSRPSLSWSDLSTFIGLADSPNLQSRVLITNCEDLSEILNQRRNFFCIRGTDLDRLTCEDFVAIETWLKDTLYTPPKKRPLDHQTDALRVLVPALEIENRVSAVMACGTGKTLITLWVAERMQVSTVLVLVPSLALLRQTLHEWLKETSYAAIAYLCVCSDSTVSKRIDEFDSRQSELDFAVSTNKTVVRHFLDAPFDGPKFVFCTYQSAPIVGAAMQTGESFDLGIFDEAHKTAGREGRMYGFALRDSNLPIRKRLFVTATPRHYNIRKRNGEGDVEPVFSMDDSSTYGRKAFSLGFGDAVRKGIICDYKVIISVITSERVTNRLLEIGETSVDGNVTQAREIANQIAIEDAVAKFGGNKIFTFHNSVKSAASFIKTRVTSRSILPTFKLLHVNGAMPTTQRERVLREFQQTPRALVTNARCLTEGVDVPAVDVVAFLSPKRSLIDIIQATGRAMRKSEGKSIGYVLVPLFLEQFSNESLENAINRSNFDQIWDVLQSLREQDGLLDQSISDMMIERGYNKKYDHNRFFDKVEVIGPDVPLELLRRSISTLCVDVLGENWFERYGELLAYQEKYGNCDVPVRWSPNRLLAKWIVNQRVLRRQGRLTTKRVLLLDEINFDWSPRNLDWDATFNRLINFYQRYGHCDVPQKSKDYPYLGIWVLKQRQSKRAGKLKCDRIEKLDAIGFKWSLGGAPWMEMFNELADYNAQFGHTNVSSDENRKLATWVRNQRYSKNNGLLKQFNIEKLNSIGFSWVNSANGLTEWSLRFKQLLEYKSKFGNCDVPHRFHDNPALANWVSTQRKARRNAVKSLTVERQAQLTAVGFKWGYNRNQRTWDEMFTALESFKRKFGSCNVPSRWVEDQQLSAWVHNQRSAQKVGKLTTEYIDRLNSIGFVWVGGS